MSSALTNPTIKTSFRNSVSKVSNPNSSSQTKNTQNKRRRIGETCCTKYVDMDVCLDCGLQSHYCGCLYPVDEFEPQSGFQISYASEDGGLNEQNVKFSDQNPAHETIIESTIDPTRRTQDSADTSLENFFSRPIKIAEYSWSVGSGLSADVHPWDLYFSNPRVENRLNNFKLLRANLRVKIVVNGNGFYYGRAVAGYLPHPNFDDFSYPSVANDMVQVSQWPKIFIDPTRSTGGSMTLPFFHHENYIDIVTRDWSTMGHLYIRSLNALKHANGGTTPVNVSVFAWATDVSLSVPTSVNMSALSPQSGEEVDIANKMGIVSGPATSIAKIADTISSIPPIAPFAKATSQVATGVAGIARTLGYSRPTETRNPLATRPHPVSSLASCTVPDTAQKMTVDDKQELTIDPRISGLGGEDPLSIAGIASRESYLTSFEWYPGTAAETHLWNVRVQPALFNKTGNAFHFTSLAVASLPFKYWTGTLKFRFQIVCSNFHKGRIKVVYDPNFVESNEYNINYMEIIDISEKQDFTISIAPAQPVNIMKRMEPQVNAVNTVFSTTEFSSAAAGNGTLGVYVVNDLTTPSLTSDPISINVYVSAGKDFEVFVPDNEFQSFVFKPQSGLEPQSGTEVVVDAITEEEDDAPEQDVSTDIALVSNIHDQNSLVFIGERILSFRTLLKRYNLHRTERLSNGDGQNQMTILARPAFPGLRGHVFGAVDQQTTSDVYNYMNTLLLHWVTYAFSGFRGSIRTKMLIPGATATANGVTNYRPKLSVWIERQPPGSIAHTWFKQFTTMSKYNYDDGAAASGVYDYTAYRSAKRMTGHNGIIYADENINSNIEFETPFYNQKRYIPGKREDWTTSVLDFEGYKLIAESYSSNERLINIYNAIGEDFQVFWYSGLPKMYFEASPPPSYVPP